METPFGLESLPTDEWFEHHFLTMRMTSKHTQKSHDVIPYLTFTAGERAVRAIRDYSVYELALAFTSHYDWQLINGAKILASYGELAKVYAGMNAVYLFQSKNELDDGIKRVGAQ